MEQVCLKEKIGLHIGSIPTLESSRMRLFTALQEESSTLEEIEGIVIRHEPEDHLSALVCLTDQVISCQERGDEMREPENPGPLVSYLGNDYKELVNTIQQRYTTSSVIVENLG